MEASQYRPLRAAVRIAGIYALVSALWILLSDQLMGLLISSPRLGVAISMVKGLGFVATTALILMFLLKGEFTRRARLTQTMERYQALAENSQDIMLFIEGESGRILEANRAATQAYGLSRAELLQKTISDLRHESTVGEIAGQMQQASAQGARFETLHCRSDGSPFPVEVSSQGLKLGQDQLLLSIIRDITERKQAEGSLREAMHALAESEQHFRGLFETMLQGVIYQDAHGVCLTMNPAAVRILGKTKAEYLTHSQVSAAHDMLREDGSQLPGLEHPAMVALRTGWQVRDVDMRIYNPKEQQYRNITMTAVPLFRAGEDAPYRVYTVFDDITARKQAEAEQKRLAEERDRLLDRLKELNLGLEQRVRERTSELTKAQEQLTQREASLRALVHRRAEAQERERAYVADQLYNEAAQVLAALQIQQGRLERDLVAGKASPERWTELKGTVDRVLSELHHLAVHLRPATLDRLGLVPALDQYLAEFGRAHQLNVELAAVSMDGVRVPTEVATALYRIVQEALANVARHAQATTVSVLIRHSDGRLTVVVEDDGMGFDVGEALRRGALGFLGMRERAEVLNGCLEVESRVEGVGTTIVVEVPLHEVS